LVQLGIASYDSRSIYRPLAPWVDLDLDGHYRSRDQGL
jgi:hypothetical protein